jgi:hypothetical protein
VFGVTAGWPFPADQIVQVFAGGSVLVDGFLHAGWRIEREGDRSTLIIRPLRPLTTADRAAVADEGVRMLQFREGTAVTHDVRFEPPD